MENVVTTNEVSLIESCGHFPAPDLIVEMSYLVKYNASISHNRLRFVHTLYMGVSFTENLMF